ncbi:Phage integrase family protein [Prochlorococcus marinus str. MIT 1313]|uniref:site-specific integrase n=1 Tax=Prochlorococcus TaxID=1218 RepID=UPI0007B3829A|nr:site-specific integrase [Prochlorococcus marinus]KZR69543.1 Phage integrase family protein [Prochlorococcus marinus str. MIT 1313]KZR72509.1 Phage integrase family protein [Prochlorococcus marinus str. MIT 1318]
MELSNELININRALADSGINLRIEQRGQWLNLRGALPCRNGTGLIKTQRISLQLLAEQKGLKEAERIVQLVHYQLQRKQFDWSQWTTKSTRKQPEHIATGLREALVSFEEAFFTDPYRRRSPAGSRSTWTSAYLPYLRRLKALAVNKQSCFDSDLLKDTLASYADGSRSRQQCATALAALARHLEMALPEDWRAEADGYGLHQARFRQLPSDKQIIEAVERIPNPGWRLAYGLMATYGLRNHEVFFCDLAALAKGEDQVLRVLPNTKTGEHQVWPFHPDWVEHFELEQLANNAQALPPVNVDLRHTTLQQVGRRVSEQFRRYQLPLTPYNLRHAWAVRTIHIGLPDTVAARMMGHSVAIHTRTYHHWITRRDQQQAVDAALARQLSP